MITAITAANRAAERAHNARATNRRRRKDELSVSSFADVERRASREKDILCVYDVSDRYRNLNLWCPKLFYRVSLSLSCMFVLRNVVGQ